MDFGLKHAVTGGIAPPRKSFWQSLLETILGVGSGGPSRAMETAGRVQEALGRRQEFEAGGAYRHMGGPRNIFEAMQFRRAKRRGEAPETIRPRL